MIPSIESSLHMAAKQCLALILAMTMLTALMPSFPAHAESNPEEDISTLDIFDPDWYNSVIILDDPELFMLDADEEPIPVITSEGKTNVKVQGVKSRYKLIKYTIPEQLLRDDPAFLALMVEAEKYIGYPYVYGAANPNTGFDCSGFVCWVYTQSGVYPTKRLGANGLYSLCTDIPEEQALPGDLVFFTGTMGRSVKGITHVGIYVGNDMMIHAGDPVGFADLKSEQWAKKIYGYGRLPIE